VTEQSGARLGGKVLLVTGAARGLGEAVARGALGRGADVLLVDVLDDLGAPIAAELGAHAAYMHLDVRDEAAWDAAVSFAEDHFGQLDVLVNNAAILRVGELEHFAASDFREVTDVNQLGPFLGMRAVIPAMRRAGRGSIINISSTDGITGQGGVLAYGSSKWALRGMSKIAAQELGPLNIRVNCVLPGGIRTEMSAGPKPPGITLTAEQVVKRWALQRFGELGEVAAAVLFLASEEATYTTGAEITCDGGATIGPRYV
jgi:3alpha(or 20beta)-hydroxysteroid dehydrogenase